MKILKFIIATNFMIFFSSLSGQEFKFRYETEFNPGISYSRYTGLGFKAGLRQRLFLTNKIALEGEGIYAFTWRNENLNFNQNISQTTFIDQVSYGGSLYYHFKENRQGLYTAIGLLKNPLNNDLVTRIGYKRNLNERFFLNAEAMNLYNVSKVNEGQSRSGFLVKIGIGVRF